MATYDGREVLRELYRHSQHSTASYLRARELLSDLVNRPLDRTWNKSYTDYLSWYVRTVQRYNSMMLDPASKLTPEMVSQMLDRAIQQCRPLVAVKDRELMDMARGMPPLAFEQRLSLLYAAAATLDRQNGYRPVNGTRERPTGRRRANMHDLTDHDDQSVDSQGSNDGSSHEYAAFMARFPGSSMNKDTWNSLTSDAQTKWDSLDSKDKAKILNYASERAEKASSKTISANVANSSTSTDLSANVTDSSTSSAEPPQDTDPSSPDSTASGPDRQANVTSASKAKSSAHPGDIRRVLGGPPPKTKSTGTRSGFNVSWGVNTTQQTPSDVWGEGNVGTSSQSEPPSHFSPVDLLDDSDTPELDTWAFARPPTTTSTPSTPPSSTSPDPFGIESVWGEDHDYHFW